MNDLTCLTMSVLIGHTNGISHIVYPQEADVQYYTQAQNPFELAAKDAIVHPEIAKYFYSLKREN
jgi:hypothetical protein